MKGKRKPFQGIWNIIRFNWHFYLLPACLMLLIFFLSLFLPGIYSLWLQILCLIPAGLTCLSLITSYYVYDLSDLYQLAWLRHIAVPVNAKIINIHAGFDETSGLIEAKLPDSELSVFDFYDPSKHTERSIKRARKANPPYPGTVKVETSNLPVRREYADLIFVILSAHEIRSSQDRKAFFGELRRILKQTGKIVVTEHLRDMPNFAAYNIGFFHFMPRVSWLTVFQENDLVISKELKSTPFITHFILEKNGTAS